MAVRCVLCHLQADHLNLVLGLSENSSLLSVEYFLNSSFPLTTAPVWPQQAKHTSAVSEALCHLIRKTVRRALNAETETDGWTHKVHTADKVLREMWV